MMVGKPIIAAKGTNMDKIVERTHCGVVVEYGDIKTLEETLFRLASDPDLRGSLGENGREVYLREYSWEIMTNRLTGLYRQVLNE